MAEQEVHGGVDVRVQPDKQDDEHIPQHCGQVTRPGIGQRTCPSVLDGWGGPGGGTQTLRCGSPSSCCSCLSWELVKVVNVNEHTIIL